MRPWRDIISINGWMHVIRHQSTTAHISKFRALRAKFDSAVDTPERKIDRLSQMILDYHEIKKSSLDKIDQRVFYLTQIADLADEYLSKFHVDMAAAKERVRSVQRVKPNPFGESKETYTVNEPIQRSPHTGRYDAGEAHEQSIDRTILSLRNRGRRKAAYLIKLRNYYKKNSTNPQDLIDYLAKPQEKDAYSTGISPNVRMEALDPWHRPVEVSFKNGKLQESDEVFDQFGISAAFAKWYHSVNAHQTPFFLWLESHEICTSDSKEAVSGTASVNYIDGEVNKNLALQFKLALVFPNQGNLWMEPMYVGAVTRKASTDGYTCSSGKGITDAAAFIWTGKEIVIAQHQETAFHHSSFNGGSTVRLAGMIKIINGKIVHVNNNSGHYKPGKNLMFNFVQEMTNKGLMSMSAEVMCKGLKSDYRNTASHFIANCATLT